MTIKILSLSGSPIQDSSTDILLGEIAGGIISKLPDGMTFDLRHVRLNDVHGITCQACGDAPTEDGKFCFYDDEITSLYDDIATCDCLLFGSPIHFDTVSSMAKLFIDRCNCFRPADFKNTNPDHDFIKRIPRKRPGAMALVGGAEGWFEGARRTIAGWFKWLEVINMGNVNYQSHDFNRKGTVSESPESLNEARRLGESVTEKLLQLREDRT